MMLLETAKWYNPSIAILTFDYQARNPIIVNQPCTINGVWTDEKALFMWCADEAGLVGMIANIQAE